MNRILKEHLRRSNPIYLALSAFILITISIAGCSLNTPAVIVSPDSPLKNEALESSSNPIIIRSDSGTSYIRLPDGSEIYLRPYSELELVQVAGSSGGASEHIISLHYGEVLVNSQLPVGKWFTILSPDGRIARVTGSIMVVGYDAATGQFLTSCVDGNCELGPDAQHLFQLAAEDQGWLDENGNFQGPFEVDLDALREVYGTVIPTEATATSTMEPTSTSTAAFTPEITLTPDAAATATAACQQFQVQYPGTPCP